MNDRTGDNRHIQALVIGIDDYDMGEEWHLEGGMHSAMEFASCLYRNGIPPQNISLYLSSDEMKDTMSSANIDNDLTQKIKNILNRQGLATLENIESALKKASGDILYLFWAGHGVFDSESRRRKLYVQDSNARKLTVDLDSLLDYLKGDPDEKFPEQFIFIDAYATDIKLVYKENQYIGYDFGVKSSPRSKKTQYVFLANKEGQAAHYYESKFGFYSKELIALLKEKKLTFKVEDLYTALKTKFDGLPETKAIEQTPTYYWYIGKVDETSEMSTQLNLTLLTPVPNIKGYFVDRET
jgi:hypothetical protein